MAGTVQLPGVQMVLWNPPPAAQSWKFPVGQPDLSCCLPPHPESSPNPGVGVKCKVSVPEAPSWAAQAIGGCVCVCVCVVVPDSHGHSTDSLNWFNLGFEQMIPWSGCVPFLARQGRPGRWPRLTFQDRALRPTLIPWPSFLALERFLSTIFRAAPLRP